MYQASARSEFLQPLSQEHRHALQLSRKIDQGFQKKIALERIRNYTDWFWLNYLKTHFEFEEKYIIPILNQDHPAIRRLKRERGRLKALFKFKKPDRVEHNLHCIQEELVAHIRFEERVFFKEVEKIATVNEQRMILQCHVEIELEEWSDTFWK